MPTWHQDSVSLWLSPHAGHQDSVSLRLTPHVELSPSGGIGRRLGLKIPCRVIDVPVRPRPGAHDKHCMQNRRLLHTVFFDYR